MDKDTVDAWKVYVRAGVYTINEARKKMGEPEVEDPIAKKLIRHTQNGWMTLDNQPVRADVEALLPKAFEGNVETNRTD